MESILPSPGTASPRLTLQMPLGPSRAAKPFVTSRTVHPLIVVGLVSGTNVSFVPLSASFLFGRVALACRSKLDELPVDEPAGTAAPSDVFVPLSVDEERRFRLVSALTSPKVSGTALASGGIRSSLESEIVTDELAVCDGIDRRRLGNNELPPIHARPSSAITAVTISPARIAKLSRTTAESTTLSL
jgi:hypothetical protein